MVVQLQRPPDPLPDGGTTWSWSPRSGSRPWRWSRVYHHGTHNQDGHTPRTWGPLHRFDPHRPDSSGHPQTDPDGRSVLYVGVDLATSLSEVFGETRIAALCPRWRVAVLAPTVTLRLFDLCAPGSAMAIGALPALADGALARELTQAWARAIFDNQPTRYAVTGIRYRSAYNGAISLALWNSAGAVETVPEAGGASADRALIEPVMLARVRSVCTPRRINVEIIASTDCRECIQDP